ncbi:MAG: gfo/Idh/MocA family oxidoreductase, partial [Ferruginibacter sp.]
MSSRRKFLHQSSLILGAGALASAFDNKAFAILNNGIAPSDQLNIGAIGINGMGWANVKSALKIPGVNLVAVCDVDKNVIDKRLAELGTLNVDASKIKKYDDYRKLLAQKDIDAVIIG